MTEIKNLDKLLDAMGVVKWVPKQILGLLGEGWFLLEINPTPPENQIIAVTTDLVKDEFIAVENGTVFHSDLCKSNVHKLKSQWKRAVEGIKREKYTVAIYPGSDGILNSQPIAVVLDPPINYTVYPDHKHLNIGGRYSEDLILPDTICYTDNPEELGEELDKRIFQAYKYVTVWLYRHQLWLACRELKVEEKWIGTQVKNFDNRNYIYAIEPIGRCRCGSDKEYIECHMPEDFSYFKNISLKSAENYIKNNRVSVIKEYAEKFASPRNLALQLLLENLT